uniref:17,1 kDa salivary protein SP02 n=1 Tax=Phlebotomus perniciosus TaxID=13204 RepID=K8DWA3_PHLPE|nr:17,1 kDa salivary protein SP02 [Phlebotomus perniciosus]
MKQLPVILLALVFLIAKCRSEKPEYKCRRDFKTEDKNCFLSCTFKNYHFIDNKFRIERKNIENYKKFITDYKTLKPNVSEKDLEKHLLDCWDKFQKSPEASTRPEKCEKVNNFERCVIDKNIFDYPIYFNALKKINYITKV